MAGRRVLGAQVTLKALFLTVLLSVSRCFLSRCLFLVLRVWCGLIVSFWIGKKKKERDPCLDSVKCESSWVFKWQWDHEWLWRLTRWAESQCWAQLLDSVDGVARGGWVHVKTLLDLDYPFPLVVLPSHTLISRAPKPQEIRKRSSFKKADGPGKLPITAGQQGNKNCSHRVPWTSLKSSGGQRSWFIISPCQKKKKKFLWLEDFESWLR